MPRSSAEGGEENEKCQEIHPIGTRGNPRLHFPAWMEAALASVREARPPMV